MAKTQFVLFNQTSSLWCPAQGAPAPSIVWRKNGIVVQYSTSVKHPLTITEENNDKYSCEVKKENGFDKKEIRLVIESEFFHKRIKWGKFLKKLWCLFGGEYYKMIWFCSSQSKTFLLDEGLTLQTSALGTLYGSKFSFQSTPLHTLREYNQRASQQRNVKTFISYYFIQGCPDPCRCTMAVGIMDAATLIECREKHLQSVPRHLPFSTAKL